ncbi:hypothetical protein K170097C1_13920 [Hungatella effluvii]|uniref:hypothetical protein n=1 Tax=Hungatella effluvii TaxID=1096246 RepID=UPI0034B73601
MNKWFVMSSGNENKDFITKNFMLQVLNEDDEWETVETVTDNIEDSFSGEVSHENMGRYYRLLIPCQGSASANNARIREFHLFGEPVTPSFSIAVADVTGGEAAITADRTKAEKNEKVTFTVTDLEEGKVIKTLTVSGKSGDVVISPTGNENEYSFKMPGNKVTIALTVEVDKTSLKAEVIAARNRMEAAYTPESWGTVKRTLEHAEEVLEDDNADPASVREAAADLKDALGQLVVRANYEGLKKLLGEATNLTDNTKDSLYGDDTAPLDRYNGTYSRTGYESVCKETEKAKALLGRLDPDNLSEQDKVDTALAVASLKEKAEAYLASAVTVDSSELKEAVADAEKLHSNDYTAESWQMFMEEVEKGKTMLSGTYTANQVKAAASRIRNKSEALVKKEEGGSEEGGSSGQDSGSDSRYVPKKPQASRGTWEQIDNRWLFRLENGRYPSNEWHYINDVWYHFGNDGFMERGWILDNGKWYYLNDNGSMATGWVKVQDKWYLMGQDGSMMTGWNLVEGKWYYLYENGDMAADTMVGEYYVNASGEWIE